MKQIIQALEEIEKSAKVGDQGKIEEAIQSAQSKLAAVGAPLVGAPGRAQGPPLQQLKDELSVWQKKLSTILKEPVGRQGMAKHARHWIGQLESGQ